MNWMNRHLTNNKLASNAMLLACILLLGSCTSESGTGSLDVNPVVPSKGQQATTPETEISQDEILLQVVDQEAETRVLGSKAIIYTNADPAPEGFSNLRTEGFFRINAYYKGTTTKYIDNSKVTYWEPSSPNLWRFCTESNVVVKHFWPPIAGQSNLDPSYEHLDFFAYLPATKPSYITSDIGYSLSDSDSNGTKDGPTFTCSLPLTDDGQNGIKEFMYDWDVDIEKGTTVPIGFVHPFARISISLTQAKQRMNLKSVSFNGIRYNETYKHGNTTKWTSEGSTGNFEMTIDKTMGTDLPNGLLGGPYLVVPQSLSTKTLTIRVYYDVWASTAPTSSGGIIYTAVGGATPGTYDATLAIPGSDWVAGNSYTYSIDLGKDDAGVTIAVTVEAWDDKGNHTTITVD